jgi:hypothetical protein
VERDAGDPHSAVEVVKPEEVSAVESAVEHGGRQPDVSDAQHEPASPLVVGAIDEPVDEPLTLI